MKATYFFSKKQLAGMRDRGMDYTPTFINGKQYTEVQLDEGEHKSNWDDAVIVEVREGLPVDEFLLSYFGKRRAKI